MSNQSKRNPITISLLALELALRFIKSNVDVFGNE